ncbi:septal ring lytic transglycosylase RlpA family protein [Ideonella sp. YS5]|uniref:septal ring lytic transglycosylase RlpA family protein n=1 Tax=Ideonella sp. YS5 TaxID=3453714 RepID=UPI003EEB3594
MNHRHVLAMLLLGLSGLVNAAPPQPPAAASSPRAAASQPAPHKLDRSGRARVGKASFYARSFTGKRMADGTRMDPNDDNAASKTLPLGTTALVTNLENGQKAVVTIQDRGPYVPGRILDVSPATARQLGIGHEDGVAKVAVAPILVPQADGSVTPGAGLAPRP